MYRPPHFRVDDLETQHAFIRAYPLATLVSCAESGLIADPIPMLLDSDRGPFGTLRAHVARANPQSRASQGERLVVFSGPQAYVTPNGYATKLESGRVVPTWNYATVHAYGIARLIDDVDWLRAMVSDLTRQMEESQDRPWAVTDAPEDYTNAQLKGIVGIEIEITRLEGKWKASQNKSLEDQEGVIQELERVGDFESANLIRSMSRNQTD